MSQSTKKPLQDLLNTQNSTEETNTNKENSSNDGSIYAKIEGTPFHIVGEITKGYIGVCGTFQITEYLKSPEEVENYIDTHTWEVCITLITMVIHMNKQIETHENNLANKIKQKLEG